MRDATGLTLPPGLHLSFQRYVLPADGAAPERAPASLGLLPVGEAADGALLLPVAEGEAFWIGVEAAQAVRLEVTEVGSGATAVVEVRGPDRVTGLAGRAFSRDGVTGLRFATGEGEATLRLVDYGEFAARTRLAAPVPLDAKAGYGGWRLP